MHEYRQCETRELWGRQFTVAHWILLALGFGIIVFTDRVVAGAFILMVSLGFFLLNTWLDVLHVRWHLKQAQKEDDDMRRS